MEQSTEPSRDNPASDAQRDLTGHIIAAFYVVKRELGPGLPEYVYANAMAVALRERGLHVAREVPFEVVFHGVLVGLTRADLVVKSAVIVEVKVARIIAPGHREQAWHQLQAAKLKVAMVVNFGEHPGTARVVAG